MLTWYGRLGFQFWLCPVIAALVALESPVSAATTIYTYTDDSGTQNFTTESSSIPEKYQSRVTQLDLGSVSNPPVVPAAQRPPSENVRVVTASGEYRMGDHDTKSDATRLAVEAAKRQALEQVATYLESITEVTGMELTRDEIRTYTAGIVMVVDQKISTALDGDTIVIRADLTAQVDPDEVAQAIMALHENESAKTELLALRSETDQLRQQLDAANQILAAAVSPEEVQQVSRQREDLLNQIQANALVSQAWTDWVYVTPGVYPSPSIGLQQVRGLLVQAQRLQPHNRHLPTVQQVIAAQSAGLPPAPPAATFSAPSSGSLLVPPAPTPAPTSPSFPSAAAGTNAMRPPIPTQALPPASSNAVTNAQMHRGPSLAPLPPLPSPLPPTLQQIHPPHMAQPNPPILRAPYTVPHQHHQGGRAFGRAGGGGGHSGGHR
ncbi:conserved exported protein of unknown function [Nitrospira japonica]|uniref:DUF4124 domain-containing protein n=1 Tax=Nitrospira japonica TaxID=1325564 RepID=A0A1W1I7F5_9BACT|nr:hypothetical protein [Nitrospira japonica]SLM48915.1 conserved exported protein of unknown function [Nitrospira japonica]